MAKESTISGKNTGHNVPCIQVDNIRHLAGDQQEIKSNVQKLFNIIDGNGNPGMKTDVARLVDSVDHIKEMVSFNSELRIEQEVQLRVKNKEDELKKGLLNNVDRKKSSLWNKIGIVIAAISAVIILVFQILNYLK